MRKLLPILALFLCVVPVNYSQGIGGMAGIGGKSGIGGGLLIGRDGFCLANTTSCTLSATFANDMVIACATHNASITAPPVPASFTQIGTNQATPNSGTLRSMACGCKVSSSSADTGTGTWTTATTVFAASYRGTSAVNTGNCNTTGIGNFSFNLAQTSTTITYNALSPLNVTNGTSWVFALVSDSNGVTVGCPTGTSLIADNTATSGCDTNGGVSTWTAQTITVASITWITLVAEILK